MAKKINNKQVFSLLEVTKSIQRVLQKRYARTYWVKAEMNKLNHYEHSGHCYPDLIEKRGNKVIAQLRANLWKNDYQRIDKKFKQVLKEPLKDGVKILFEARIKFHPLYGLSLQICDIDPSFTLGDLAREKQETLSRLKKEGILNQNKQKKLPILPRRIAVISVETSNGYADFLNVLEAARIQKGFHFFHFLFPSLLQGDRAVDQLMNQLRKIRKVQEHFDLVVIIRGGGGEVGLSCYNHYKLAREIALFPLPVITGIGHSTNKTVAEMVAYQNAITPTKLGESLVTRFQDFSRAIEEVESRIVHIARHMLQAERHQLTSMSKQVQSGAQNILLAHSNGLQQYMHTLFRESKFKMQSAQRNLINQAVSLKKGTNRRYRAENQAIIRLETALSKNTRRHIAQEKTKLEHTQKKLKILSPQQVLKRGYSITLVNGKSVQSAESLKAGDVFQTRLYKGELTAKVESVKPNE